MLLKETTLLSLRDFQLTNKLMLDRKEMKRTLTQKRNWLSNSENRLGEAIYRHPLNLFREVRLLLGHM